MTLSINDTQHNNALQTAECRILFTVMLSAIILSVVMLNVVMLSVAVPFIALPFDNEDNSLFGGPVVVCPMYSLHG
jgi:hypothetical protein